MVLATILRFVNLDHKIYWMDEANTALFCAGNRYTAIRRYYSDGHIFKAGELQSYLTIEPNDNDEGVLISVSEDPKHTPGYFLLARHWAQLTGGKLLQFRWLSAIISSLVQPAVFWLCLELFASAEVGLVAAALCATSPIHYMFAQEARGYALWTLLTLLSSALLLRAIRVGGWRSWLAYSFSASVSAYSYLLSTCVSLSQFFFVVACRNKIKIAACFCAVALASLSFCPWLLVAILNWSRAIDTWSWVESTPSNGPMAWMHNLCRVFFDVNIKTPVWMVILPDLLFTGLAMLALIHLIRKSPKRVWLFVLFLMSSTALPLLAQDMWSGGMRSLMIRYMLPFWLGLQLATAYLLTIKIKNNSSRQRSLWQIFTALVLFSGLASCVVNCQSKFWWNKHLDREIYETASAVNSSSSSLLLVHKSFGGSIGSFAALGRLIDSSKEMALITGSTVPAIPSQYKSVFLYHFPDRAIDSLRRDGKYLLRQDGSLKSILWIAERNH